MEATKPLKEWMISEREGESEFLRSNITDTSDRIDDFSSHEDFTPPQKGIIGAITRSFRNGSINGSVFNLCSATLGAGSLALPYSFAAAGLALGSFLLTLGAVATIYSIRLLVECRLKSNLKSYEELTLRLFGRKAELFVQLNIILFCYGVAIAYCRAVGDILKPIIEVGNFPEWFTDKITMTLFWLFIMFPLSLIQKMDSLRFSSLFGVLTIFFLVIATAQHTLEHISFEKVSWNKEKFWIGDFSSILRVSSIVIFAFTCQVNVFAINDDLEKPSARRMGIVTNRAIAICFFIYFFMSFFGYLEFEGLTCGNILQNYRQGIKEGHVMVIGAYLSVTLTTIMAYPLVIFPCRASFEALIRIDPRNRSFLKNFVVTLGISGSSLVISLFVSAISTVFQLVGGTTSAIVCFVLPAAFALKLEIPKSKFERVAVWSLAIGGAVVGILATIFTLIDIVEASSSTC